MIKIKFSNVGRFKASWEAELKTFDWDSLYKQVKGRLMSKDIDFDFSEESGEGVVIAGDRIVGQFKIVADPDPSPDSRSYADEVRNESCGR